MSVKKKSKKVIKAKPPTIKPDIKVYNVGDTLEIKNLDNVKVLECLGNDTYKISYEKDEEYHEGVVCYAEAVMEDHLFYIRNQKNNEDMPS